MGDKTDKIENVNQSSHTVVKVAHEGFGKNSASYDSHRPGYTKQIVDLVVEAIQSTTPTADHDLEYDVLELGAGTGKLTELVAPHMPSGCRYLATEPSVNFLDCLKAKLLPIQTLACPASAIPLPDSSVGRVVCAQSLHWFATEESLAEIHRVLAPGGKLILVWNLKRFEPGHWANAFYKQRLEVMAVTGASTLNWVNSMEWRDVLDKTGLFNLRQHESLPGFDLKGSLDTVLSHVRTISCYNMLPPAECQAYLDRLRKDILEYPGVDPDNVTFPFSSEFYVFQPVDA